MTDDKLAVALRVLNALTRQRPPAPDDIAALKTFVAPAGKSLAPDDLARLVMNNELGARLKKFASSEESVGEGERQRCLSMRNLRNFLQVESNDLC
jgi:hypothetical protein